MTFLAGRAGVEFYLTYPTAVAGIASARLMSAHSLNREVGNELAVAIDEYQVGESITVLHTTTTTSFPRDGVFWVATTFYDAGGAELFTTPEQALPTATQPHVPLPTPIP